MIRATRHGPNRHSWSSAASLIVFLGPLVCAAFVLDGARVSSGRQVSPPLEPLFVGEPYREVGDLEALRQRGQLRVLVERSSESYLPRTADPLFRRRDLVRSFGLDLGVETVLVPVETPDDLIPALLEGRGDVISANLVVTEDRKARVAFSLPHGRSRQQIVSRRRDSPQSLEDLAGRILCVRPRTLYWDRAEELRQRIPALRIEPIDPTWTRDEILDSVSSGAIDLTIEDSNVLEAALQYRPELSAALDVSHDRAVSWAVRPTNPQLLGALNAHLQRERLAREDRRVFFDDLPGIRTRRRLRLLTRNHPASYFLWRGELRGLEYELVEEFARRHKLRVEVVVADSHADLFPLLREGRGDLIAASLTPTAERRAGGVAFSRPYHHAVQRVVSRADERSLSSPRDLGGRTVVVRRSSAYWESLMALQESGIDVMLEAAPETLDVEEIVDRVATGEYDLTVADNHVLELELTRRDDVIAQFALGEPQPVAWAVREDAIELLRAIDDFWAREYRGPFYNTVYRRYFRSPAERVDANWPQEAGRFTEWDGAVKRQALEAGFDWRLIMALMYQESRFDPQATSWAGARGLLQVMPQTALQLGVREMDDPIRGIEAGIRYLAWLREQFDPELYAEDRIWFALAAYNTGLGHVLDAQRVAKDLGWNHRRWFGHVERAMPLLSRPEFARLARHGYLSGRRPVAYVRLIRDRYSAYIALTEQWEQRPVAARNQLDG
jgi:membrane-bound lytic murein transglycosylase F